MALAIGYHPHRPPLAYEYLKDYTKLWIEPLPQTHFRIPSCATNINATHSMLKMSMVRTSYTMLPDPNS